MNASTIYPAAISYELAGSTQAILQRLDVPSTILCQSNASKLQGLFCFARQRG